jgi:hypothetical protein
MSRPQFAQDVEFFAQMRERRASAAADALFISGGLSYARFGRHRIASAKRATACRVESRIAER